ncbi:hypothetical protein C7M84_009560 [Penaeus vannamei]|uniref:tRNA-splicing endonuclease subunit Sen54 N-terminal domain-containing protein n=1 Tax=Penaeus vannamei TaxID=6689 RepID=A0A3R7PNE1_PENVA|nr:hypothetical protein C7M84_009560 [Penaeus vannamei]
MNSFPFTRGGDLLRARGRDQLLPSWGQKEVDPSGSWLEEKQIDARLRDRQMLLEEPKFARRDAMACGEWLAESRMVRIVHEAGDFWQHMGAETDIGKCLYPEESIYLIETGELEVTYGDMPLSIQQAQSLMLQDAHQMDMYIVYTHLTRNGCKVIRHQPHLLFTRYEKVIRWQRWSHMEGPGRVLWRGHTVPLIKPGMAASTQSVLAACSLGDETSDVSDREWKIPKELQLSFHFDVYLPNVPYRKSQPSQPSKRITVLRDGQNPTPGQILDITTRFHDDVPVVSAVVVCGEVRLYTLSPVNIPQPSVSA